MFTQRSQVEYLLNNHLKLPDREKLAKLFDLLDAAQNKPEYGGIADGSISDGAWTALQTLLSNLRDADEALKIFRERIS